MKNKLDWFDDNWNWDVRPTRVLYELLLSPTYRWPWKVKEVYSFKWDADFPRCPLNHRRTPSSILPCVAFPDLHAITSTGKS